MTKILIITLSNIGDVLLTLPSIQALREKFPQAEISLVVGEMAQQLFEGDPRFKKVWVWRKNAGAEEKLLLVSEIISKGFNQVINFRNPVGFRNWKPHRRVMHFQKLVQKGIANADFINEVNTARALWLPEIVEQRAIELLKKEGVPISEQWMIVTPGSLNMTKRWKVEGFVELCRSLVRRNPFPILLTGDESDHIRSQEIVKQVQSPRVFDLCGKTELLQLAWLIREAKLLISHDSAPLHMAGLFGTPVVAIFGPTDPLKYGSWRENSRVVRKTLFCSPCEKSLCVYHHECMEQIQPKEILDAVNELIS